MKPALFADLHCHPGFYAFNRMRNHPEESDAAVFHPWSDQPAKLKDMARGQRASTYAQSSVAQLMAGRCRLVFASITPIEKGFLHGGADSEDRSFWRELAGLVTGETTVRAGLDWVRGGREEALKRLVGLLRSRGPARVALQSLVMRYGIKRIGYLISDDYDYWDEFLLEYEFFRARDGQPQQAVVRQATGDDGGDGATEEIAVAGAYHLVRDAEQLGQVIENSDTDLALVLTIEGGHVFTMGPDGKRLPEKLLFERIAALKALDHPIFFVTLAHHFDNGVCGHAHSLPDTARLLMNQLARMHEGLEPENDLGARVLRELLDLDDDLVDRGGRRILIDVKHMSAQTRREFYERVVVPYNARHESRPEDERERFPALPVIFSHAAYAGVASLDELIANADREDDNWHRPPFYAWNINLCDEDVRMVHRSGGLIGIVFDERICGVPLQQKVPDDHWPHVLAAQIFAMVDVIMLDDRLEDDEKASIWDCITIGSDYDGFINPLSRYPTAVCLPQLADDLRRLLEQQRHTRLIERIGVDTLIEKIAWRNAYNFARRHLPAATG